MCHHHFEITLGPKINFVCGPNGSECSVKLSGIPVVLALCALGGKSAILTALTVGLGAKAGVSGRAKSLAGFINSQAQ